MSPDMRISPEGGTIDRMEYLDSPGRERRRLPRAAMPLVVLLVVAVGGFLWWSDSVQRSATEQLAAAFESSAARAASGERQVQGTLAYASPMIWSTSVPETVREGLRALVEESAAEVAADLSAIGDEASSTLILPWQEQQLEARQAVLALIEDQRVRFSGIAEDASDIDLILADGPVPTGVALASLRASGATGLALR